MNDQKHVASAPAGDGVEAAIADAKEFVDAAESDGFDAADALDLIREFAALALPRAAAETVEFVREWLMSGDHPVSDWERQFAAAIDARPRAAVGEQQVLDELIRQFGRDGIPLTQEIYAPVARAFLALQSPPAKVEG